MLSKMRKIIRVIKRDGVRLVLFRLNLMLFMRIRVLIYKHCFSTNSPSCKKIKINTAAQFVGLGSIEIESATIGFWPSPGFINGVSYFEARSSQAKLKICSGTIINNNAVVVADRTSVEIGKDCLIGPNVFIADSDFHGVELENRRNGHYVCLPVIIEDNVFIGGDVKILKGVRVGSGAVIANGSLVTKNVESNTVVAGVPAKLVKRLT